MSVLSQITRGIVKQPILCLVYGTDGVGKSTFAAKAPNPVFLGPEMGTASLDVNRLPKPKDFRDVILQINALTAEEHKFKTLVVDSLDWLEPLVWDHVCKENNWETIESPGWGKGYVEALTPWRQFISALSGLREHKQMNIVLVAHSQVKLFQDPQNNAAYDRYQLKLHDKAAALLREFCDDVLFTNFEVYTKTDGKAAKAKAFGEGDRVIYTERRPAFDAKNRHGLPFELPLDWKEYAACLDKDSKANPDDIKRDISSLLDKVEDDKLKSAVMASVAKVGTDPAKLAKVRDKLRTRVQA